MANNDRTPRDSYFHSRRKSRASTPMPAMADAPRPSLLVRLAQGPDALQVDAGASGEVLVARIRLLLTACLLLIPLVNFWRRPSDSSNWVGLGTTVVAAAAALAVLLVVNRDFYRPWIGFATSVFDVSLVSAALAVFLILGQPHTAVNSKVVFEAYFLAIGATSLRYDPRICVLAGALAGCQYLAIVAYASTHWDLNDPRYAPFPYGMFDWTSEISRLILLAIATLLSSVIVMRTQTLRRLSRSDKLTGLPNRSYFDERVLSEVSRARRYGHPISLAMIDVDHFKLYNDTYGHAAGDLALKAVASTIRQSIRETDLIVRYGGEEFVAVLPEMSARDALDRIERVRRAVAATPLQLGRRDEISNITISAGVATFGVDGVEVEDLLDVSDARLFQAKERGRNRVVGPPVELLSAKPSWRMSGGAPDALRERKTGEVGGSQS